MELTIAQTLTRPGGDNRLSLEITLGSGAVHVYDVDALAYYGAIKRILLDAGTRKLGFTEPVAPPSTFEPLGNPS